jgi:hypothetical protein
VHPTVTCALQYDIKNGTITYNVTLANGSIKTAKIASMVLK